VVIVTVSRDASRLLPARQCRRLLIGYWSIGLWTSSVTRFYLTSLPVVVVAIVLGRVVNKRMSGRGFAVAVYGLLAIALLLLIQSARSYNC
jgi:hypothetical protein